MPDLHQIRSGEGTRHSVAGADWTWKARSEDTCGAFCVFEQVLAPGQGVPPHTHGYAETFYVLEGELGFGPTADGRTMSCQAGDTVLAPAGAIHGFANTGSTPARLLSMAAAAHQGFFDAIVEADQAAPFADMKPADVMTHVAAIGRETDTHFLTTPPEIS